MTDSLTVVFDGPAGVGKSTIAKDIAKCLGFQYIDTGAMYRLGTLLALENKIEITEENQEKILELVTAKPFQFQFQGNTLKIYHGNRDVSDDIRRQDISRNVSYTARLPKVRSGLTQVQREMAANHNVVMEGRDIGTVVLPNATHKFFLTASVETRAQRRFLELEAKGFQVDISKIQDEIATRDMMDSSREHAPLRQAPDAIVIDTSHLSIDEVKKAILSHIT